MNNEKYEAPQIVYEGDLEVQAGSPIPPVLGDFFEEFD